MNIACCCWSITNYQSRQLNKVSLYYRWLYLGLWSKKLNLLDNYKCIIYFGVTWPPSRLNVMKTQSLPVLWRALHANNSLLKKLPTSRVFVHPWAIFCLESLNVSPYLKMLWPHICTSWTVLSFLCPAIKCPRNATYFASWVFHPTPWILRQDKKHIYSVWGLSGLY